MSDEDILIGESDDLLQNTKENETVQHQEEKELTEFEKEQMADGWNPKGEKSAEEWARNRPLYDKLKSQSKQIKSMSRALDEVKSLMTKQEQLAYDRALADIKKERIEAIKQGDVARVEHLDSEAENLKPKVDREHPAVLNFKERHVDWLGQASYEAMKMTNWAKKRDQELLEYNLSPEEHIATLEEHLRAEFPSYFTKASETSPVEMETSSNVVKGVKRTKFTYADLSAAQKKVANDFKNCGLMSIDEYIKSLVKVGDLK